MGDKYEAARVKMKNPDGPPPKGAKGVKAAAKAKVKAATKAKATKAKASPAEAGSKRKKRGDDDKDDDDNAQEGNEGEEDEDKDTKPPPAKCGWKAAPPAKTAKRKRAKTRRRVREEITKKRLLESLFPSHCSRINGIWTQDWNQLGGRSQKLDGVQYALPSALLFRLR